MGISHNPYVVRDRYFVEHKFLRDNILGDDGQAVLSIILFEQGKFFVNLYSMLHEDDSDYQCPYRAEDFSAEGFKLSDDTFFVRVNMPEPETEVLCSMIVIAHDEEGNSRRYITVEGNIHEGAFLCEWQKDGVHANYGSYSEEKLISIISRK